jgi:hypothetical protein
MVREMVGFIDKLTRQNRYLSPLQDNILSGKSGTTFRCKMVSEIISIAYPCIDMQF